MRAFALGLAFLLVLPVAALAATHAPDLRPAVVPQPGASASLPLASPVGMARIYRDAYGVPHIFADDSYTLYYANGYAQAQDRFFAMDVLRHVGRGEAARVLGPGLLASDFAARRDLYTEQERLDKFLALDGPTQRLFEAYVDGVNRAVAEMTATGELPGEFIALNHAPEPWTVLDSIAVADFLLDRFGTGGGDEVNNAHLLAQLERTLPAADVEAAFGDLVWTVRDDTYTTVPASQAHYALSYPEPKPFSAIPAEQQAALQAAKGSVPFGIPQGLPTPDARNSYLPFFDPQKIKWGSNALLIAPSLSANGQALLGGGPQTGYYNPEILFEVGLHGAGTDVVGVGVMGAPGVVLGRTPTFAWTVTSGEGDETDMVALPAAGDRSYTWDGQTHDLACRQEAHVAINPPALGAQVPQVYTQEVCVSQVGVVTSIATDAQGQPTYFFAAHKAHRFREEAGAALWLGIDQTKDLEGFRAQFEGYPFTFNFNYAGPEGACYHHVGVMPIRNLDLDPRFPTPAGSAWDWQGERTGAQMPRACNPAQGFYANWNNDPMRGWPSGDSREQWGSLHRVQLLDAMTRLQFVRNGFQKFTLEDVQAILRNAATHDPFAPSLAPLLAAHAPPAQRQALLDWASHGYPWADADGDGVYDDLGYSVYLHVRQDLQDRVFRDELAGFTRVYDPDPKTAGDPHAGDQGTNDNKDAALLDALSERDGYDWCDDVRTPQPETCGDVISAAFAAVDAQPMPVWHSRFTPIGAGPAYEMPMTNRATYYHFHVGTDTTRSISTLPAGQSGQMDALELADVVLNHGPGPEHMRDQLPLYNGFQGKPVPVTEAQAQAVGGAPATLVVPIPPEPLP